MDIIGGLTATRLAFDLARDLREIDHSVDAATYKSKMVELMAALSDTKLSLIDAKEKISQLETELDTLKTGHLCPRCRSGKLQLTETKPHLQMGLNHYGVEIWNYVCASEECGFSQRQIHDPHGVIPKAAAGKTR